jgi:hypothetical protein
MTTARLMPPFPAAPAVRPLAGDISLSDAQIATIVSWATDGAPLGDPGAEGPPIALELPRLSRVDLSLEMDAAYVPTLVPDEYRCFVIPWPLDEARAITGSNVRPGNEKIDHHAAIFLVDAAYADAVDEADGADGKPGYPCFGGATPPGELDVPTKIVASWVPGQEGGDFPAGTGIRVKPGARIILQMHYSLVESAGESDLSAIDFRLDESVPSPAGNLPFLDVKWPSDPESMKIPAGEASVIYTHRADPTDSPLLPSFAPGINVSEGLDIHGVLPHMHKLGRRYDLVLHRADGTDEPLLHIGRWDFHWQRAYRFAEPVRLAPGDELSVTCEWDNSARAQPTVDGVRMEPKDVTWGEGTYDEMCVASLYVTGVATGTTACSEFDSVPSGEGRFAITFVASDAVAKSSELDGPLAGTFRGAIYRAEDVEFFGPVEGAESVASLEFELDLRDGPDGPYPIETLLPAGDYSILGFLDIDGNIDPENPDADQNDPVLIPGTVLSIQCAEQAVTAEFLILRP